MRINKETRMGRVRKRIRSGKGIGRVNLFKKLLTKNRTLEEELKFTTFTIIFCLFIFLPIVIISIILGG